MKRALISLILVLAVNIFTSNTHAQTPNTTPTASLAGEFVNYDLAFPGMLPDHPLYKLKVLRDKISVMFIVDPQKKIKFYLTKADKEILASAMLVDNGKIDLATQTALKAEHNFTMISQVLGYRRRDVRDELIEQLETAALKHQEVLLSLAGRVPENSRQTFLTVVDFSKRNMQTIKESTLPYSSDTNQNPSP